MKYCNKCNKYYPATTEYFYTDNNKKDKLGIYCKTCTGKYHVKYHEKKKKERKKFEKIYRGPILDMSNALNLKIISKKQYKLGQTYKVIIKEDKRTNWGLNFQGKLVGETDYFIILENKNKVRECFLKKDFYLDKTIKELG